MKIQELFEVFDREYKYIDQDLLIEFLKRKHIPLQFINSNLLSNMQLQSYELDIRLDDEFSCSLNSYLGLTRYTINYLKYIVDDNSLAVYLKQLNTNLEKTFLSLSEEDRIKFRVCLFIVGMLHESSHVILLHSALNNNKEVAEHFNRLFTLKKIKFTLVEFLKTYIDLIKNDIVFNKRKFVDLYKHDKHFNLFFTVVDIGENIYLERDKPLLIAFRNLLRSSKNINETDKEKWLNGQPTLSLLQTFESVEVYNKCKKAGYYKKFKFLHKLLTQLRKDKFLPFNERMEIYCKIVLYLLGDDSFENEEEQDNQNSENIQGQGDCENDGDYQNVQVDKETIKKIIEDINKAVSNKEESKEKRGRILEDILGESIKTLIEEINYENENSTNNDVPQDMFVKALEDLEPKKLDSKGNITPSELFNVRDLTYDRLQTLSKLIEFNPRDFKYLFKVFHNQKRGTFLNEDYGIVEPIRIGINSKNYRREEILNKKNELYLVIDGSGSMQYTLHTINSIVSAIASYGDVYVYSHTSGYSGVELLNYGRNPSQEDLQKYLPMGGTESGKALWYIFKKHIMKGSKGSRKIVIEFTDGQPIYENGLEHTKSVVNIIRRTNNTIFIAFCLAEESYEDICAVYGSAYTVKAWELDKIPEQIKAVLQHC